MATAAVLAALALAACGYPPAPDSSGPVAGVEQTTPTPSPGTLTFDMGQNLPLVKFPDGLKLADIKVGDGATVKAGSAVTVQYAGYLTDGTKFDANDGLCAILDASAQASGACTPVIQGWIEGVPGMKVGGSRRLVIPPTLGYGSQAQGPIPANSTLIFIIRVEQVTARP
ncbi:MAG: FKBP-type peptidyl-prolyl cis-trans isomerase [Candidatus Dormibacteraeota bacterium]|nr:FKBP-type peptidyl-prolyl cis-trans isomerase [Candidatus Dormibacteraeota bacterium]